MEEFLSNNTGQMQMQLLQIPTKDSDNLKQEKLDVYLGVAHGLTDPFNFFINITDIKEKSDHVYFFSYSMGKKRVVLWGTYDVFNDEIKIESGCRYDSWKFINYINIWKEMNYQIYDVLFKNKFTGLINKFSGKLTNPKKINNEEDLRAWKYMSAYFDNNISQEDFIFLFDRLDLSQLSYNYENYISGKSPLLDFYDLFNISDLTEEDELSDIIDDIKEEIKNYENTLNYLHDTAPDQIKEIVMRITKLFLDKIMRSKYVGMESVNQLPSCPDDINECDVDDLENEKSKCSVFTYGKSSFNKNDRRYGLVFYEEDLT